MSAFKITWQPSDGYAGGDRPQHLEFHSDELSGDETDAQLSHLFWETIREDFEQKVTPTSRQESDFIIWAKEQIEATNREND